MAASYFSYFWAYLLVSFLELVAYILYFTGNPEMLRYLADFFYYGFILYIFPWAFAALHIFLPVANGGLGSADYNNN